MKKVISFATIIFMCISMLAGCGASDVKLEEVMEKINSDFSLSLTQLESADELKTYYSISPDDVKQFAAEIDSNNNAPVEIVMIEAVDSTAADNIEQALTTRYNSIYSQYSSYSTDRLDVVRNSKVTKDGNFVSMIVAEKSSEMLEVYYQYVK